MVLSLWGGDLNRVDSYRVSMVAIPESPIFSGARGPWQQHCWLLALSCRMMGFCATKCRRFLLSTCNYDLFAKVKEPLRGPRYNTRDKLIRAIERSVRNINKDGRADGVRRLPNIWQKVIRDGIILVLKVHKCCTPVDKAKSEISNCCHYFLSNPCICKINFKKLSYEVLVSDQSFRQ